jgi:hypothetical protein
MGLVWAVRRSLRLLTLLTLMASALCAGQTLAAQDNAAPRVTPADSVAHQEPPRGLVMADLFEGESAVTIASAISSIDAPPHPVSASAATFALAPVALASLPRPFSPLAERAPPAA